MWYSYAQQASFGGGIISPSCKEEQLSQDEIDQLKEDAKQKKLEPLPPEMRSLQDKLTTMHSNGRLPVSELLNLIAKNPPAAIEDQFSGERKEYAPKRM